MNRQKQSSPWWLALVAVVIMVVAQQPLAALASQPVADDTQPVVAASVPDERASVAVSTLDEAHSAVVQIEAVGTFVDPQAGWRFNAAGRGSGFIINEAGIAVTNNHVVTGAAYLKVHIPGERKARNARVLGVSECSDLAVIDIEGGGYPYLAWYEGPIKVGLDVYAAGFPLGDPEFTLTRGIIAKARTQGDTGWSSVQHVVQHDATINPGNSGGPLIDNSGRVVGVNFAGNGKSRQYFAIARETALPVIEQLSAGVDLDSIGINGQAITDGESFAGIWVAAVQSGSPADRVGLKPGDLILSLEGVSLGTDGTMATYCDILRSHGPGDVLNIQVLRLATEEVLAGQLNGRLLTRSFSVASNGNTNAGNQTAAGDYTRISDRQDRLAVEVPSHWTDVRDGNWTIDEQVVGVRLAAAPDIDALLAGWDAPGLLLSASATLVKQFAPDELLDAVDYSEACRHAGRTEVETNAYTGLVDHWERCGTSKSTAFVAVLVAEDGDHLALVELYALSEADQAALEPILNSLTVSRLEGARNSGGNRRVR
jgi:serine protease Do